MQDTIAIVPASRPDADAIARVVSIANRDVADRFGLTMENAPRHPSFCTTEWILSDMDRGQAYFVCRESGMITGCVAFEQADAATAYLNRLAVLPEYRHNGLGSALVRHILTLAEKTGVKTVSIGIIAEHERLKRWYQGLGFVDAGTKRFDHLPFTVGFMHYAVRP
ncbi:GCN5-related N-acetyltransferase [Desulfosarcina cetonica]|uniref:GNAT family N-acetyltransferase n=1 Tax=Desulfosarcina cetonica TaxID=90730 RepID=UPI001BC30D8F|nr:GNAT family N-acetyltransferase [Desulfosarcina cetonica]VTR64377.1 GCN5-related N-acetyltransferase [Desulfosarcina cetonica]